MAKQTRDEDSKIFRYNNISLIRRLQCNVINKNNERDKLQIMVEWNIRGLELRQFIYSSITISDYNWSRVLSRVSQFVVRYNYRRHSQQCFYVVHERRTANRIIIELIEACMTAVNVRREENIRCCLNLCCWGSVTSESVVITWPSTQMPSTTSRNHPRVRMKLNLRKSSTASFRPTLNHL